MMLSVFFIMLVAFFGYMLSRFEEVSIKRRSALYVLDSRMAGAVPRGMMKLLLSMPVSHKVLSPSLVDKAKAEIEMPVDKREMKDVLCIDKTRSRISIWAGLCGASIFWLWMQTGLPLNPLAAEMMNFASTIIAALFAYMLAHDTAIAIMHADDCQEWTKKDTLRLAEMLEAGLTKQDLVDVIKQCKLQAADVAILEKRFAFYKNELQQEQVNNYILLKALSDLHSASTVTNSRAEELASSLLNKPKCGDEKQA